MEGSTRPSADEAQNTSMSLKIKRSRLFFDLPYWSFPPTFASLILSYDSCNQSGRPAV